MFYILSHFLIQVLATDWISFIQNGWHKKCFRFQIFQIMEYLYVHKDICWSWDLNLNAKFSVSCTFYTHNPKTILYNILNNFVLKVRFHDVEFSICGIILVPKNFWIFKSILDFSIWYLDAQHATVFLHWNF
jgi:hypothetical protein